MASRALTQRLRRPGGSASGRRSPSTDRALRCSSTSIDFGNVSRITVSSSLSTCARADRDALPFDAARERQHLADQLRAALGAGPAASSPARDPRRSASAPSSTSIDISTGVSTLLRSWAMPPARVPMLSMRCARRNCRSSFFRSVMSRTMASRLPVGHRRGGHVRGKHRAVLRLKQPFAAIVVRGCAIMLKRGIDVRGLGRGDDVGRMEANQLLTGVAEHAAHGQRWRRGSSCCDRQSGCRRARTRTARDSALRCAAARPPPHAAR